MHKKFKYAVFFLLGLLTLSAAPAFAETTMYLCSSDENLQGEATAEEYSECIEVLAWSWGATSSGTFHQSGGGGAGKPNFDDLVVTKWVDSATPGLLRLLAEGEHAQEVILHNIKPTCCDPLEYYRITMSQVLVTSFQTGGAASEDRLTENVTLNFAAYEICYVPEQEDGTGGAERCSTFDIQANSEV